MLYIAKLDVYVQSRFFQLNEIGVYLSVIPLCLVVLSQPLLVLFVEKNETSRNTNFSRVFCFVHQNEQTTNNWTTSYKNTEYMLYIIPFSKTYADQSITFVLFCWIQCNNSS